jgi:cryptochrome
MGCLVPVFLQILKKSNIWNFISNHFRLFIVRGSPKDVFPKLFKEWGVTKLTYEVDIEPYAVERDSIIDGLAKDCGVEVVRCVSNTLYDTQK